ncbi:Predicted periplasmic/secreted protein [Phocoenobacter uteri]|uniref:Predicted periplasmic/secreted protein n=1 Tax=Phocoenobacter uteri TaxID=146806 RepID=A0A379CDR3_9PAST|nr:SIMPL domain-containing protein [Phocoenobacter uteri]MDG6881858.1 hypothetical protein [Phocoenobacter uteri]SUB59896.1 Predicted periplasmic/secreted protein [Phocoenobacter uteri]
MKLQKYLLILPLMATAVSTFAQETITNNDDYKSTFHFATEVRRTIDKDLMLASVYSRKTGESLTELREFVSKNLNKVLELAKQYPTIEVEATGIQNYPHYEKEKVKGWEAQGNIEFKSKDFKSMEKLLASLGENIALNSVYFTVSPEKWAMLEDELTTEMIQKLQHKAEVIKLALNAKEYILDDVKLGNFNDRSYYRPYMAQMTYGATKAPLQEEIKIPLEAGKETIVSQVSGTAKFK